MHGLIPGERTTKLSQLKIVQTLHRGAFYQFPFQWIYYYGSNKSTGQETGKTHLCALFYKWMDFTKISFFHKVLCQIYPEKKLWISRR